VQWDYGKEEKYNLCHIPRYRSRQGNWGATGGIQGLKDTLFGKNYIVGSWQDKLIETFSGTHDLFGGRASGLYDEQGNIKQSMSDAERKIYDNLITTTAIFPSAPFAAAEFIFPAVWQAISVLLKGAQ